MKKRIAALCLCAILVIAAISGGTLAFFTSDAVAHNVITTGKVDITLKEYADAALTQDYADKKDGVMPGMTIEKYAVVTNNGTGDAWVRIKLTPVITLADGTAVPEADARKLVIPTIGSDWTQGQDGYYYYSKKLAPGETTTASLEKVTFAGDMGNDYQRATAVITVEAQAVQVVNNGDSALAAKGWPVKGGVDTGKTG